MPILTETGQVEAMRKDGVGIVFTPSFFAMAEIGSPTEIVQTYADLFDVKRMADAAYCVLSSCANDDGHIHAMLGYFDVEEGRHVPGSIPVAEQVVLARHLMLHGVSGGKSKPEKSGGSYSPTFDVSEYIDAAMLHFGLSEENAGKLTMTRFCRMLDMKYPKQKGPAEDITIEEYDEIYAAYVKQREAQLAKEANNG